MFYIPRTQPYYRQQEYQSYGYLPLHPVSSYDEDYEQGCDGYVETKRHEYLEALHEQQQHREYERAVALENQRHRARLSAHAEREVLRNRHSPSQRRSLYGYEQARVSTLNEPIRRPQPAPKSQPQPCLHLDDWQSRLLAEPYVTPAGHTHLQNERECSDKEEDLELEEEQHEPQTNPRSRSPRRRSPRRSTRVAPTPISQTQAHSQTAHESHETQSQSARVRVTSLNHFDSDFDSPNRTQALTTIARISHTFDTLRQTFSFPAGPLERDPNSSTLRLAYNPQNSVVHAYENALSGLLTKLDAVESYGSKAVRDTRKELVVQIERELVELEKKVMKALGVGEEEEKVEEKVGELIDEAVEKAVVEDVQMEDCPSVAPTEAPEDARLPRWEA